MSFTSKKTGMYSCKLSLYAYAAAIQAVVGIIMIVNSPNELNIGLLLQVRRVNDVYRLGFDLLQYCGIFHLLLSLVSLMVIIMSHFVTSIFKLPMFVLSLVQTGYCSMTTVGCFYFLQRGHSRIDHAIEFLYKSGLFDLEASESLVVDKRGILLTVGLLTTIMASLYQRAGAIRGDESTTVAMIMAPTLSLSMGVSFVLTAPCRDYRIFALGFTWFAVAMCGEVIITIAKCPCLRPLKIMMVVVYVLIFLLSLITICHAAKIYTNGTIDYVSYLAVVKGTVENYTNHKKILEDNPLVQFMSKVGTQHTDEQINVFMGNGSFLLVAIGLSVVCAIFAVVATLYSLFRVLDHGLNDEPSSHKGVHGNKNICIVVDSRK
ncbi:hypothetical protein BdWA1_001531 [Babesia duncani]|uniref:Uncharacterized protein n=1 Tax=Babesia duncani TaxID=323732 RepID=A0AAD9PK21_9APIC|nr:hypothetical protein BdWA1_001531 [Babesia duncani]